MNNDTKEILNGKYKKIVKVDFLEFFHPNGETQTILKNDDYFLGNRANHFVIIDGYDEDYDNVGAFILICNHKGSTTIQYYIGYKN